MKETIYQPGTGFGDIILIIKDLIKNFSHSQSLGYRLAQRNIKAKYRRSVLGIFWMLLPPLATAAVWIFLRSQNIFEFKGISLPYPVFVITGTILWQIFRESITVLLVNLQRNKSLLIKINFPHEALVFSAFFEILFGVVIKLLILIAMFVAFQIMPSWQIVLTLIGILSLILLGMSIGLLLSPLSLLYDDISYGIPIILQFALYLTPVVYARQFYTGFGRILNYNPVTPVLTNAREWIFGINTGNTGFILVSVFSIFALFIGIIIYKLCMQIVIERISA